MEAVGVIGGSSSSSSSRLSISSSFRRSPAGDTSFQCKKMNLHLAGRVAAFHSPSNLFISSPSSSLIKPPRKSTKSRVFLPHLVASLEKVEETYIMVKPDGVQRGLVGEIISRFEKKGFKLTALKLFQCPKPLAEEHYKDLKSKSFYPKLIDYITSGPVVCMAWEGVGVVASARKLIGSTDPLQAEPGTIRGDLAVQTGRLVSSSFCMKLVIFHF
ncbi:Nucleoside diphosphate kinase 2, chloroplastic [Linum perenne]